MKCPNCGIEISASEWSRELGRHTSEKKRAAARANGKLGGRPRKTIEAKPEVPNES